jgi:hypothetical protein
MLQVCFGTYLVLGLPVILLLWTALAASRMHYMEEGYDRQRFYQIVSAISNFKNAKYGREYDLLKDRASVWELDLPSSVATNKSRQHL